MEFVNFIVELSTVKRPHWWAVGKLSRKKNASISILFFCMFMKGATLGKSFNFAIVLA